MNNISSWGNIPKYQHKNIFSISDSSVFHENKLTFLSHGLGRSYGDVCLLDKIIMEYGGALYPAKGARMSKEVFETSFPKFDLFSQYIDPRFSSSFCRRIK